MGSFNVACAISGLPCTPGDPVYAILLTRNKAGDSRDSYPNDVWVPRTPAMLGTYADYGRVDFSDEIAEQTLQRLACVMLDLESVETSGSLGRGGHVRHGMGLAAYLNAIDEGTLVVSCESSRSIREMNAKFETVGATQAENEPLIGPIPTVSSVVAVLEAGGLKSNDPAASCFFVSEVEKGEIVVSCESWGRLKIEEATAVVAKTYAAVIARGRGHDESEVVRVFPKPKAEGWVGPAPWWIREDPRSVALAVVRADVWDAMLKLRVPSWRHEGGLSLDHYVEAEQVFRDLSLGFNDGRGSDDLDPTLRRALNRGSIDNILWEQRSPVTGHLGCTSCAGGSGAPGITGWSLHHEAWRDMIASKDPVVLETAAAVGLRFAECCMVYDHMATMSMRIMPSKYAGQDPQWGTHANLHHTIAEIAMEEKRKDDDR